MVVDNWQKALEVPFPEQAVVGLMVSRSSGSLQPLFSFLYAHQPVFNKATRFSLVLELSDDAFIEQLTEEVAQGYAGAIVFHTHFYLQQHKPVLFHLSATQASKAVALLDQITASLTAQRYTTVEWIGITTQLQWPVPKQWPVWTKENTASGIASFYKKIYLDQGICNRFVILKDSDTQPAAIAQQLQQAEDQFHQQQPMLYATLQQLARTTSDHKELQWHYKRAREEATSYKTYLQLILEQDEAKTINDFYKNEYEILPLWYKQLGHIIKVLTGKRTLRSLFDKTAKKYKN